MNGLIGKKLGMTRIFTESGESVPVTVLHVGPCIVTAIRDQESAGYDAVQVAYEEIPEKKLSKPVLGQFKKNNLKPHRYVREFRSTPELVANYKVGDELKADFFTEGEWVDVSGISKGKGFQGVVKRYGFGGGPKTHGQSDRFRAPGSLGQSSYPSRVFKGLKMAGRTGSDKITIQNLRVMKVDAENNIIMVGGAVPGAKNSLVRILK